MATRNSAGWLILAAALAVPGFLFYQWWSNLNAQSKADLERRVRNRLPAGQQVFGSQPSAQKLNNPILQDKDKPAAPPPAGGPAEPAPGSIPALAAAAPELPQPADGGPSLPSPVAEGAPAAAPAAPPAESVLQTGPIAQIVLARDPMLSPFDVVRIAEAEARARRAQEELDEAARRKKAPAKKKAVREPPPETLVELQGIVSTESGDKAIVNGEVVGEGDLVGNVKVVKISPSGVVFAYRNKRFIKGVNK